MMAETTLVVTSERLAVAPDHKWDSCSHEWQMYGDGGDQVPVPRRL
jgi:hypothetical protein